jgi:predicted PurR-regulated permease PerM
MQKEYPYYLKTTIVLLGLTLLVFALSNLQGTLIPLAFSVMVAILINPMVNRFERWHFGRSLSISIALAIAIIVFVGLWYFIAIQLTIFTDELPLLKQRFSQLFDNFQEWVNKSLGIVLQKQNQYIAEIEGEIKPLLGQTMGSLLGILGNLTLMPVYIFLILYYKTLLLNFFYEIFSANVKEVGRVLNETKNAVQSYMVGLLLEALAVAALNSLALLILGVQYAVLLGVLGAILNLLPYLGGLIAIALPMIVSLITKDGFTTPLLIVGSYLIIQFIDNNFLVPLLVSSKVRINALFSIIIVLLGGSLWGFAGMFLSIPFIGILKIIFDRIDGLRPWGKLLGDQIPTYSKHTFMFRRKNKKSVAEEIVD